MWFYESRQFQRVMPVYGVTAVAFVTVFFGFVLLRVDRHQYAKDLVATVRAEAAVIVAEAQRPVVTHLLIVRPILRLPRH